MNLKEVEFCFCKLAIGFGRNASTVHKVCNEGTTGQRQQRHRCTGADRRTKDRQERLLRVIALRDRMELNCVQ